MRLKVTHTQKSGEFFKEIIVHYKKRGEPQKRLKPSEVTITEKEIHVYVQDFGDLEF